MDIHRLSLKRGECNVLNNQQKKQIHRIIENEKIKTILYPTIIFSFVYGFWISIFPDILRSFSVYHYIRSIFEPWQVGGLFMALSTGILISFHFNWRWIILIFTNTLLMLWSMFTVSFLITSPPNTVWLYAIIMTYFSFSLVRRV